MAVNKVTLLQEAILSLNKKFSSFCWSLANLALKPTLSSTLNDLAKPYKYLPVLSPTANP